MKIKTSELKNRTLAWSVANAAGYLTGGHFHYRECQRVELRGRILIDWKATAVTDDAFTLWNPTEDWAQAGPIIERECIEICPHDVEPWWARVHVKGTGMFQRVGVLGPTPLIAAMRCYVASKLGDEIEIPGELK